jgi:glycosyltransferase involved in cell wall biosynthesis
VRILWVKANKLLPVESGGSIRSFHIARHLAARHELTFFSYYAGPPDPAYQAELARFLPGAVALATGTWEPAGLARGLDYVLHLPRRAPYAVSRFASAAVREKLAGWFGERRFDIAVCDFLQSAVNFPSRPAIPAVLFQHNVETEIWRRHVLTEPGKYKRLVYGIEFSKMMSYERKTVREFDHVIAVSPDDQRLMAAWVEASRISVVPTGVDLAEYRPEASAGAGKPLVVFVGAMDWEPNVGAVEYFCREIWPRVAAAIPEASFRIVGRNPVRRVQELESDSVEVTGRVPSVLEHLREAAVAVVPLLVGGGTRLKIYEAMAAGKAVVSTTVGAEGLDVHHGSDILLADDASSFADAVLMLLRDEEARSRYGQEAARQAARYDWAEIAVTFEQVLERVAGKSAPGRSNLKGQVLS